MIQGLSEETLSLENSASLDEVPKGGRIHVIGVCGVAMGAMAISLARRGYQVSGSDKEFYPPISTLLEHSPVVLFREYDSRNIPSEVDLVIIGNSVPSSNVEVETVRQQHIPHTFFAKLAGEMLLTDKRSIVVTGTHGKTTTTALIAYGLNKLGLDPSYFIGGEVSQLPSSFKVGDGAVAVVEGDEYDSVFYVKRPKFLFYRPDILVINAIEFDHADIYSSLDQIVAEFRELVARVPSNGRILACIDYPAVRDVIATLPAKQVLTFGRAEKALYRISATRYEGDLQVAEISSPEGKIQMRTLLVGEVNALNVLASYLAVRECGVPLPDWLKAISDFQGASRRFQVLFRSNSLLLLEDFAHHPTAVREAIQALKTKYPLAKHWIAFEPRSNTSRRAIFQREYGECFEGVDRLFLRDIEVRYTDQSQSLLDVEKLKTDIEKHGTECLIFPNGRDLGAQIIKDIQSEITADRIKEPIVITIMSNGAFDGLPRFLKSTLEQHV